MRQVCQDEYKRVLCLSYICEQSNINDIPAWLHKTHFGLSRLTLIVVNPGDTAAAGKTSGIQPLSLSIIIADIHALFRTKYG